MIFRTTNGRKKKRKEQAPEPQPSCPGQLGSILRTYRRRKAKACMPHSMEDYLSTKVNEVLTFSGPIRRYGTAWTASRVILPPPPSLVQFVPSEFTKICVVRDFDKKEKQKTTEIQNEV